MALTPPPTDEKLIAAFPGLTTLNYLTSGGYKHVYDATANGNREAFKLLALPSVGTSDSEKAARLEYISRAKREITLLGKCHCPELVKLGSLTPLQVEIDGVEFLGYSEEFLSGKSIVDCISQRGAQPSESEVKQLFISLLCAIRELWTSHQTVHRDIKPLNVIKLQDAARPYVLLDLGIAYQTSEPGLTSNPGIVHATVPYLAPEMLNTNFRQSLDFRADIYTAAITTFEYATFIHPLQYRAEDPHRTISRILRQQPIPLHSLRSDFSSEFCRIIDQSLKKSPPLRPGNIPSLITRINAI